MYKQIAAIVAAGDDLQIAQSCGSIYVSVV